MFVTTIKRDHDRHHQPNEHTASYHLVISFPEFLLLMISSYFCFLSMLLVPFLATKLSGLLY